MRRLRIAYLPASLRPGGAERQMLALRTGTGLAVGESREIETVMAWATEQSLLESDESVIRLTRRGRLLGNELFSRLLPGA